jgi:hypothetical protein
MKVNCFLAYKYAVIASHVSLKNAAGSKTKGLWETEG